MAERPCPFCKGTGKYRDIDATAPRELRWTVVSDGQHRSSVSLIGELTEAANIEPLLRVTPPVVLELSGLRYINTPGSLLLSNLLEKLQGRVSAERCSPTVVRQLNLLPALSDLLPVKSVILPHECPTCHVEHNVLIEIEDGTPVLLTRRCGTCFGLLEPDEPTSTYFAFLEKA
jgi:hypothetical protein